MWTVLPNSLPWVIAIGLALRWYWGSAMAENRRAVRAERATATMQAGIDALVTKSFMVLTSTASFGATGTPTPVLGGFDYGGAVAVWGCGSADLPCDSRLNDVPVSGGVGVDVVPGWACASEAWGWYLATPTPGGRFFCPTTTPLVWVDEFGTYWGLNGGRGGPIATPTP